MKKWLIALGILVACGLIALLIAQELPQAQTQFSDKDFDVSDIVKDQQKLDEERQKMQDEWNAELRRRG